MNYYALAMRRQQEAALALSHAVRSDPCPTGRVLLTVAARLLAELTQRAKRAPFPILMVDDDGSPVRWSLYR